MSCSSSPQFPRLVVSKYHLEVNLRSRSNTIDIGTFLITSFTYNLANLSMGSVILMGKNKTDFVSRFTTTHIASLPFFPFGNLVTKPMAIFSHSILELVVVIIPLSAFDVLSSPVDISHILTHILLSPSSYSATSNIP